MTKTLPKLCLTMLLSALGAGLALAPAASVLAQSKSTAEVAAKQKFVVAPFIHMPWYPVDQAEDASSRCVDDWQVRFFSETLKETCTGAFESPVSAYVLGAGWRDFSAWPPQEARMERLFLHSQGRANTRFGDFNLVDVKASCTAEIVYDLAHELGATITREVKLGPNPRNLTEHLSAMRDCYDRTIPIYAPVTARRG